MNHENNSRRRATTNLLLAGCCGLLALNLVNGGSGVASTANAQASPNGGLVSAAEQRKQTITAIKGVQAQITRLEQRLSSGINVRVTEMPRSAEDNRDRGN